LKSYPPNDHRNVALIGHGGAGKTSLAEALLFRAKATPRQGKVDDGSSVLDYLPEELKRHSSVSLSVASLEHRGKKITLIDTPGFPDFEGDVVAGLAASDAALLVVAADSGMEVGSELTWRRARERKTPAAIVINAMDKDSANAQSALASVQAQIGPKAVALQIPIGTGPSFTGVVDVLHNESITFSADGKSERSEVPADLQSALEEARASLMENAAESSEELMNTYFENGELTQEELRDGLMHGVAQGDLHPVFFASAETGYGATRLLDAISEIIPGPSDLPAAEGVLPDSDQRETREASTDAPMSARVFKTAAETHVGEIFFVRVYSGTLKAGSEVFNASRDRSEKVSQLFTAVGKNRSDAGELVAGDIGIAVKLRATGTNDTLCDRSAPIKLNEIAFPAPAIEFSIAPTKQGEEDKMGTGLQRISAEDPTFRFRHDDETHQTLVAGLGETHLDMVVARLKERFGVEVALATPRIPYRETIRGKADVQGRHKKQTGGRGQFGDVYIKMEPGASGDGYQFHNKIVGGSIPARFIPAVEKGIGESAAMGVIAGYPVVDFTVTLYDGSYHNVDSSEAAFKVAGSLAFKKAVKECQPTILEPYLTVKITVPKDYMGDVMGDMSSRRGRIQGMEAAGDEQVINAQVPMGEMQRYAMDLRAMSQGRGRFEQTFSHYEELPRDQQDKVIAESKKDEEVEAKR
jgi:elongation factor G